MNSKKSQKQKVKEHLIREGEISSWAAIQHYHITRISEYIRVLRKEGLGIDSVPVEGEKYVIYTLKSQ